MRAQARARAPHALILLYRSAYLAADTLPITALADALAARGFRVTCAYVTSLKDKEAAAPLAEFLVENKPDVIVNTTAFSARLDAGSVLDDADCPVIQAVLSGSTLEQWQDGQRGPRRRRSRHERRPAGDRRADFRRRPFVQGRDERHEALEFTHLAHRPEASRVAHLADLAAAWTRLRRLPAGERRLACILSDYPGKGGRSGYAVGLDTPQSVARDRESFA